ncbi:hypothetical protein SAMN05216421_1100 [Halopseudomonas xinjiangensis]|uniref:Uncharacterized protein n=1 Tax=Halopseudomonas xinjiangensis TaxID=487184 RepID=A0A1H1QBJ4_9GAMM|nr:hypothetical protein [Halopseudomonas xinjiangensis]SDS20795.1 hypothetical protein SAMN05216421_1100 [Halopseudomonas xinjiangensis]
MSEPATTTAGGLALYKIAAFCGVFAVLAAIVVMAMTMPRNPREYGVALVCTVVSGLAGGAFVVRWYEMAHWANDYLGLVAIGGVIFVCSLPGWVLVRAYFAYVEARKELTLLELIVEIKGAIWK